MQKITDSIFLFNKEKLYMIIFSINKDKKFISKYVDRHFMVHF